MAASTTTTHCCSCLCVLQSALLTSSVKTRLMVMSWQHGRRLRMRQIGDNYCDHKTDDNTRVNGDIFDRRLVGVRRSRSHNSVPGIPICCFVLSRVFHLMSYL